jgi:hypothetical protein
MGAWSHEPFGNDTACDWSYELMGGNDLTLVREAVDAVLHQEGYLEADLACEALAAAEVLSKLMGKGTQADAYTTDVEAWLATVAERPDTELLARAQRAIDRILADDSELRALWEEGDEAGQWSGSVAALRLSLRGGG